MNLQGIAAKRIFIDLLIFLSAFFLPWYVPLLLAVGCFFYFPVFLELIAVGILIDSLYNVSDTSLVSFHFAATIGTIAAYVAFTILKKRLRFNDKTFLK